MQIQSRTTPESGVNETFVLHRMVSKKRVDATHNALATHSRLPSGTKRGNTTLLNTYRVSTIHVGPSRIHVQGLIVSGLVSSTDVSFITSTGEGFRNSRRCSGDTYPESCITEYTLVYEDIRARARPLRRAGRGTCRWWPYRGTSLIKKQTLQRNLAHKKQKGTTLAQSWNRDIPLVARSSKPCRGTSGIILL